MYFIVLLSQYVEDEEDGQSDDGDESTSPKPFDKYNFFLLRVSFI